MSPGNGNLLHPYPDKQSGLGLSLGWLEATLLNPQRCLPETFKEGTGESGPPVSPGVVTRGAVEPRVLCTELRGSPCPHLDS